MFLVVVFIFGLTVFYFYNSHREEDLAMPIPDKISKKTNPEVTSLDFWLPNIFGFLTPDESIAPQVTAKSALVYDLTNEKVIYEKNTNMKLPMASITKLMTAIVAIDHKKKDDRYIVPAEALVGENTIGLSEGEIMSLEELLYGVFMYSGNDAAETIAMNTMEREDFIKAMNDKGSAIGLENTNFTNPTGLEGDGDQYTTAYDLLVLSKYALANYPQILKASSTAKHYLPETKDHYEYYLYSQLNLLTTYPGVKGLKDGYTPEAGWCLVTYLEYEDHKLVGIILGSEDRRNEMKQLLDYSLNSLGITPPPHS